MIEVYGWGGKLLGEARSFGEAKGMQKATLPDDLHPLYAGVGYKGDPLFYAEMITPELAAKYPTLSSDI